MRSFNPTILMLLGILIWATAAPGQDVVLPVDTQFHLFTKIMSYDRNLVGNLGDKIGIGVVYQAKYRKSLNVKNQAEEFMRTAPAVTIESVPCEVKSFDLNSNIKLAEFIQRHNIKILYVAPLRAFDLSTITRLSRENNLITVTGVPEYVENGLTLGFELKGDKPRIIINLEAAKAEGVNFSSQLLRIARIVDENLKLSGK